jgi:prepilin-type N-terminal cleavage/methylation domain-containing protein
VRQRVGGLRAGHSGRDQDHGQAGFSLVEMMVAILVLGVVLAALASSLISFSAMSLTNERRVQATAFLTRLHEQLQSIPWDQAAIYDGEQVDLDPLGVDLAATPPTVGGEPLVLLGAPDNSGCPGDEPECGRLTFVPRAFDVVEIDDREYELYQAVTWDVDAGNGQAVKRFTTLVRWEVWGRVTEQRFESTRAATVADLDASTLPEVLSLLVTPNTVALDASGENQSDIEVRITFERGITSASLQYTAQEAGNPVLRTVVMTGTDFEDAKPYAFVATIPAGSEVFLQGDQDLVVVGLDGLNAISAVRTVTFVETGSGSLPPEVASATVNRTFVEVGTNGADNGRLCQTLTLEARVNNLVPSPVPGTVVANYVAATGTGADMTPPATITGSNDLFTRTFPAGSVSPWSPTPPTYAGNSGNIKDPAVDVTDRFDVIAENPDGSSSGIVSTDQITFRAKTTNGGRC